MSFSIILACRPRIGDLIYAYAPCGLLGLQARRCSNSGSFLQDLTSQTTRSFALSKRIHLMKTAPRSVLESTVRSHSLSFSNQFLIASSAPSPLLFWHWLPYRSYVNHQQQMEESSASYTWKSPQRP